MFEIIFFPETAERYRAEPLVEQRERYLVHLGAVGTTRCTLRKCANDQISLVHLLHLQENQRVQSSQIEAAAEIWSQPKGRRCKRPASLKAKARFVSRGSRWLRFLGWLEEHGEERHLHRAEVEFFEKWLRDERGLATATTRDYCEAADRFLDWLARRCISLNAVSAADLDDAIAVEYRRGVWSRRTIHDYSQRLRAFLVFAEMRGWCKAGLSEGIMPPKFMADEGVPKGIRRDDVLRLLASLGGDRPVDKRDRAIIIMLVTYGLRAGEIAGLRLDDIDWENDVVRVRCPKPGQTHTWPISPEAGNAILSYIREGRPVGYGRTLFLTSFAPIRPITRKTIYKIVHDRLSAIGVATGRRGPHALRHAAAQHLLDQGISMKVIGDFLGHRDPSSTAVYAKVDLVSLREIGAFDLEGLV